MAVRKMKGSWWVDFRAAHIRYRKRSPENSRGGAEAYEAVLRQRIARGESIDVRLTERECPTFESFSIRWIEDYVKPNNKYSEQLAKRYALSSSLIPFFGTKSIVEIKGHDIERYKAEQVALGY